MQPLPPEVVGGIDQRAGQCDAALDALVAKYRKIAAHHGTAAGAGVLAGDFYSTQIRGVGNIVDLLVFAIARLAELEQMDRSER